MKVFMFMSGYDRKNVFKNIVLYLCVSALFILPISTLLTSLPAFAAGYFDSLDTQGKYKFYVYARVMNACFMEAKKHDKFIHGIDKVKKGDIWENEPSVYVGTFPGFTGYNSSGGYFECNSELINAAISQFNIQPKGRSSAAEVLLCEIGYRRDKDSLDSCINGTGPFFDPVELGYTRTGPLYPENKIFNVLASLSGYKKDSENSDPSIKYLVSRSMIKGCVKDNEPQPQRHDSKDWEIPDVDSNGNLTNSYYLPGVGQGYNVGGSNNREWPQDHYGAKIPEWQCMNIYQRLVESAPKYQEALKQSATDTACAGLAGDKLKVCKDGVNHKGDSTYCEDNYKNPEEVSACKQGQSAEIETPSEGGNGEEEGKNSCGVDGIGWLVCPLMSFAGSLGDASYSAISYFLSIDKGIFEDQSNGGLEQAWKFFRDIANAVFAVIFLWIIFSQISNVGVSNYGIKKILPRLIIGALLVNLSFYLCKLAVDLSNILGFSLKGVLEGAASGVSTQSAEVGTFNTLIVGGLALAGVGLFIFLAVSIPTIMALLLALLVVLVILIVRQAAVILLIAISPLAFAAWLLPNTENLFKKWVSMLRGLLIVFPVISLLYGAGKLAGAVLAAVGTNDPNNPKETMQVAALAASILPLGATPFVLKSSLNSLGSFAGKLGGLSGLANKKLGGAIGNSIGNSRLNDLKKGWQKNSAKRQANRRSGNTWLGRKADALRGSNSRLAKGAGIMLNPRRALDNSWLGRATGLSEGAARSQAISDELFENEVKGQALALRGMTSSEIATIASTGKTSAGKKVSRSMYAATIDHTMSNGGFEDRAKVLSSLAGKDAVIKNRAIKAAFAKGDNNILGNGFGDDILQDKVGNITDLKNMAINNAADGNLQAEHLVQNAAGTEWLVKASIDAATDGTNGNAAAAVLNIKGTASTARSNPNTAKNINGKLDSTFRKVGA